jgi:ligand-binding SRPBCC domain-containing protein
MTSAWIVVIRNQYDVGAAQMIRMIVRPFSRPARVAGCDKT